MTKPTDNVISIAKPAEKSSRDKFKSKKAAALSNVETLPTELKIHNIAAAKDFVRVHPDEENYWSSELCFVNVPIKGQKRDTLHLIDEDLALQYIQPGRILRFRLALATKPYDVQFLCQIPSRNLDNECRLLQFNQSFVLVVGFNAFLFAAGDEHPQRLGLLASFSGGSVPR